MATGDPSGSKQRVLELLVAGAGREFSADRGAGASCHWCDAGVGGEVSGGGYRAADPGTV